MRKLTKFDNVEVICRDNLPVNVLKNACNKHGIHYLANKKPQGFAENNNDNFIYAQKHLGITDNDYFILINPDIQITASNIQRLISELTEKQPKLASVSLFLDKDEQLFDDNVRYYPNVKDFVTSFLFNNRNTMINRRKALPASDKIWVSGSFMGVKAKTYQDIGMMDSGYYMYCEDIDICKRLNKKGIYPTVLHNVKAVHYRRRRSKFFCSQYFFWHISSVLRYSLLKTR